MKSFCTTPFIALVLWSVTANGAQDTPPSWRGQSGSTLEQWTFAANSLTPAPDTVSNPYGTPTLSISPEPVFATGWYDTFVAYGTNQGFWDIARGSMSLQVPNSNTGDLYQYIQVQVTYWLDISQAPTFSFSPSATQIGSTATTLVSDPAGPGAWYSDLSTWLIQPSPNQDMITLLGGSANGSVIDFVSVDTLATSVPEPSAVVLATLGGLGLLLVLRRHRR